MRDRPSPAVWLVALPPVALAFAAVVLIAAGQAGANPFWPTHAITISEAAALRDTASVAAMAESGLDLTVPRQVRPGLLDNAQPIAVTPAEAAIRADRIEILALLFLRGLEADTGRARDWICLAASLNRRESLAYLSERFPEAAAAGCPEGEDRP